MSYRVTWEIDIDEDDVGDLTGKEAFLRAAQLALETQMQSVGFDYTANVFSVLAPDGTLAVVDLGDKSCVVTDDEEL